MSATSAETPTPAPWSLAALFPSHDSPEMKAAFDLLDSKVASFEEVRSQLSESISTDDFAAIMRQLEEIMRLAYRIHAYASLWFHADTQDQEAQAFMARVEQFMANLNNRTLFFELWWKNLDDDTAERLMSSAGDPAYWLEVMRLFKPHTLSEPEEKVINIKDVTGAIALRTLYDTITNRYVFNLEVDGEVKELTRDALMVYVQRSDADLRARAYQELYRVYRQDAPILGQIYQALVRDWRNENVDLRRFPSPIAVRNLSNDIPDEVVDTLLDVSQRNSAIFHRYFRLKARWLGMDRLRRYDIYAPVSAADKTYEYDQAVDMVLGALGQFDPQVAAFARRLFDEDRIDSEVRHGKDGGAFCLTVTPDLTPWVLLNYQGKARDVATMAHELGHAIHSMLASDHSVFTFHASIPLAETASTFAEMLLVDRLLEEESDDAVRRDVLFRQVDDAYASIQRQAFFALFERQAHDLIHQGASVDALAVAYKENLDAQFGDSLEISDEFQWEWIAIPHIYQYPFYVYGYSFGQLLVLSLYQQYQSEGESFKPRYRQILASGGSNAPVRILMEAGIDIHDPGFWQGGFDVVARLVDRLEAIPVTE